MDIASIAIMLGAIYKTISDRDKSGRNSNPLTQDEITAELKKQNIKAVFKMNGNMISLMEELIVEPLLVISEDAMDSKEYDKVSNILLDTFTGHYIQSFNMLQDLYGLDSKTILTILGTDNGLNNLKTATANKLKSVLTAESGFSNSYDELMGLTLEAAIDNNSGKVEAKLVEDKKGILGNAMLTRNIVVTMKDFTSSNAGSNATNTGLKISLPITIKARVVKVSAENIAMVSEPNKNFSSLTTWLDVKSGLSTLSDYLFQTSAVKKYKENRLKGNEFLELITKRKLSAYSKLSGTNMVGFELNYTLLVMTTNDKTKLEKLLNLNIFKEAQKDDFLKSTQALACAVLDESSEMCTFLTPIKRGISTVTYREIKNIGGKKDNEFGDLLQSIFKSKLI